MKRLAIYTITVFVALTCLAANQRNYIYVFDCTFSMQKNGCWETSKKFLEREISQRTPQDRTIILPFEKDVKEPIDSRDWKVIEPKLNGYCNPKTMTNICDAWSEAQRLIDDRAENYVILLTDGEHECDKQHGTVPKGKGHGYVAAMLKQWKMTNPDNVYGFYVMVNKEAVGVKTAAGGDDPEHRLWFIDATSSIPEFGAFASQHHSIPSNTLINGGADVTLNFSCASQFPATITCDDPNFDVALKDIKKGKAVFHITAHAANMEELDSITGSQVYHLDIEATPTNPNQRILNKATIKIKSPNAPELGSLAFINNKSHIGDAYFIEPTLFGLLKGDSISPIEYVIAPHFNAMAKKNDSWAEFKVMVDDPSITIFIDGKQTAAFRFDAANPQPVKLALLCSEETVVGDHIVTFAATKTSKGLVVQNENPAKFKAMKEIGFDRRWHPVKTGAMWLGIALLAFLLLWMLMLKRMFYPVIKVGSMQVSGDSGFQTKKIQGARRVVLSSRKTRQSWINRILTAPVISLVHPSWVTPIVIEPGGKNFVRLVVDRNVLQVDPFAVKLQRHEEYKITDTNNKTNTTIVIN